MKYICKPISRAAIAIMPLAAIALTVFLVSCSKGGSSAKPDNVDYYTCTMHPSVRSQDPKAKCPICSMDLVPVKKKNAGTNLEADVDHYTCTMHPSVKSHDPKAKCPICSMDLLPVMKLTAAAHADHAGHVGHVPGMQMESPSTNAPLDAPTEFTVPVERQQQIGVTYTAVEKRPLQQTIRAVCMA